MKAETSPYEKVSLTVHVFLCVHVILVSIVWFLFVLDDDRRQLIRTLFFNLQVIFARMILLMSLMSTTIDIKKR